MSSNLSLTIYTWGFTSTELADWPPQLIPNVITKGPFPDPVLVHARDADGFVAEAAAHPLADGRLATAVLYDPGDWKLSPGMIVNFAATVRSTQEDRIAEYFACPQQFLMAEYAEDLQVGFLQQVGWKIAGLPAKKLPLPATVTTHLQACPVCRESFNGAVARRKYWHRSLFCPTSAELSAYVKGEADQAVAHHLEDCAQCRAEAAALRTQHQGAWLKIPLTMPSPRNLVAPFIESALVTADGFKGQILAFLSGMLQGDFLPVGLLVRRRPTSDASGGARIDELVSKLMAGNDVKLERQHRDMLLKLTHDGTGISISDLHGESEAELRDFSVDLWSEGGLEWSGASSDGELIVPLFSIQRAIERGSAELEMRTYGEDDLPELHT